jgi:TMEM175 potassium channel family protein
VLKIRSEEVTSVPSEELSYHDLRALERVIFFSDAVFAIAITLLVLNIAVPIISPNAVATELPSALLATAPKLFSYALSFLVIGAFWLAHTRTFHYIERYDRRLAGLNLFFLLFVALIPFPTAVLSEYGSQPLAAMLYAATLTIISLLLSLLWYYASHNHRLIAKSVSKQLIRIYTIINGLPALVFFASIGVAVVSFLGAITMWVLAFVLGLLLLSRARPD